MPRWQAGRMAALATSCINPRAWPSRLVVRYLVVAFLLCFGVANYILWYDTKTWDVARPRIGAAFGRKHPIQKLMLEAKSEHERLLAERSTDLHSAAARYRSRRGRHPPPGFDKWFQAAADSDAIVVEEYFDRIYSDINPFWALDVDTIAKRANSWHWVVRVRNGTAEGDGNTDGRVPWLQLWTGLVREFAEHMPDVDMPINYMDEPRLLVPHDDMAEMVEKERAGRTITPTSQATREYSGLAAVDAARGEPYDPKWLGFDDAQYWTEAVKTCGPTTPAYGVEATKNLSGPAEFPVNWDPEYAFKGYVRNWTAAMDFCSQPHLRELHGSFVEPVSMSTTEELIPLFGGSKLLTNNEILIPGAMYLTDGVQYSGGSTHGSNWATKTNGVVWRGAASGGRFHEDTWQHFQRHRLVEMLNATTVSRIESEGGGGSSRALSFEMPDQKLYPSTRRQNGEFGAWLRDFANVGFGWLCPDGCDYLNPYFSRIPEIQMKHQYDYKFLPDADGNSFSARFRAFMLSTSLPLKATVYAEWHDDRLRPWVHFVPLDNTFRDLYAVLEYFGDGDGGAGDAAARFIADAGKDWSEKVLRREDMRLYTWRVLLEWARVCDENRDTLGYVDDL